MGWSMSGNMHEICNCEFLCPCWFDLTSEPDQGFCKSALVLDIAEGNADGVNLSGRRIVVGLSFPHTFAEGNATVRLYVDPDTTSEQQQELEAIVGGNRGGPWEAIAPIVSTILPTERTDISIEWGDVPTISVAGLGAFTSQPMTDGSGRPAQITGAVAMGAFQCETGQPARPTANEFGDVEHGNWQPRSGMILPFNWQV